MTESQVPSSPSQRQRLKEQLLQLLRRDLNRLTDSNRGTRLHGARAILDVFKTEAARRAAASCEDVPTTNSVSAARECSDNCQPAYSEVFLESVYGPISVLCADAISETSRAIALELLQLVVNEFLSREEVVFLCSGVRRNCNTSTLREMGCPPPYASPLDCCERAGGDRACQSSGSGNTNIAPLKPLVAVLSDRLRANPAAEETSEELRLLVLHLLQQLVQQYATSPYSGCKDDAHQEEKQPVQGWDTKALADSLLAGVAGALRDRSPSNALEACQLLSIMSVKLEPSLLLQVAAVSAANHITTAAEALRDLLQQESAAQNKLRVVQLVRRLLQEMSPLTLLRPKVQPQLLLLLFLLLGDDNPEVGEAAKRTLLTIAPRSVMYCRQKRQRRDRRRDQKKLHHREAKGGSSSSSDVSSEDSSEQLYGFCSAAGGGIVEPKQHQHFHQGTPLLLLVHHAVLRELRGDEVPTGSASSEPWNCEGLQELGACTALCCSLQALELSVHCAGLIAQLLPPCAWLPHVAAHLGLQREAVLYTTSKEAALAAAIGTSADSGTDAEAASASTAVRKFLEHFPRGYKSVVELLGLREVATQRPQKKVDHLDSKLISGKKGHACSVEAKQHALLLLARMLRSLKLPVEELEQPLGRNDQGRYVAAGSRGEYELGEEELFLLVRIIEQMQAGGNSKRDTLAPAAAVTAAAAVAEDNGELLPYVAAPLLQLLLAGGPLCKLEAKRLFAAALVQGADSRSHPEIAKAAVRQVCGATGMSPLLLYLSFIGDFVKSELGSVITNEDGEGLLQEAHDSASAVVAAEEDCYQGAVWTSKDPRPLLLLRALHGADEAADGRRETPDTIQCPWLPGLLKAIRRLGAQSYTNPQPSMAARGSKCKDPQGNDRLPSGARIRARVAGRCVRLDCLAVDGATAQVSLLCVSQVIPALLAEKPFNCQMPSAQAKEALEQPFEDADAAQEVARSASESKDAESLSTQKALAETTSEGGDVAASIALLSPLLVCCIDDDWNVDVRALAVGVLRQLFLDLREQHETLKQLATATAGALQQRLDDAREDIRVAAAAALGALLLHRPPLLHRGIVTDVYKRLCLCLDDRNQVLASAAAAALLAGAEVHRAVLLEELRGAECRCLFPERYKQVLEKAQGVAQTSDAAVNDAAPQHYESEVAKVEDMNVGLRQGSADLKGR
ncbi:hypothetical protein Emed_001783 [Eimeria media]